MIRIKVDEELELRTVTPSSAQTIFQSIRRSKGHLGRWLPFVDETRSVSDTRRFIKNTARSNCHKKDLLFQIVVNNVFAGLISLKEIDKLNSKAEIGYWLDESMVGKGFMIRSCKALVDYAFKELELNRIFIKTAIGNEKSAAIPVNMGFYKEGVERNGEFLNGKFQDLIVFSILKNEWKS